jgi:hypothetical protein
MIRISLSFVSSFLLFYLESAIVMQLSGFEQGIHFADYNGLAVVFVLNFFLSFAVLTQLTPWFMKVNGIPTEEDETSAPS